MCVLPSQMVQNYQESQGQSGEVYAHPRSPEKKAV